MINSNTDHTAEKVLCKQCGDITFGQESGLHFRCAQKYVAKLDDIKCACGQPHTITIESSEKNAASILIKDYIARVRQPICNLILSVGSFVTKDALVDALANMDDTPFVRPQDPTWIHKPGCPTPYQWGVIEFGKKGWVCRDLAGKPQLKKAALYCDGCGDAKPKNPEVV